MQSTSTAGFLALGSFIPPLFGSGVTCQGPLLRAHVSRLSNIFQWPMGTTTVDALEPVRS